MITVVASITGEEFDERYPRLFAELTRLGQALYGAGQKDAALKAFTKAKDKPNGEMIARLWSLYVRGH